MTAHSAADMLDCNISRLMPKQSAIEGMYNNALENLSAHDILGEMPLDPGIRRYVLILRAQGIETFESCQGGNGHSFPEPTVRFFGNSHEGYRAFTAAMNYGLPVLSLRRYYQVVDSQLEGPWWEMTFRTTDQAA